MSQETTVALVERATRPSQTVATGILDTIVDVRDEAGIEPAAAVTVVDEAAATRERGREFVREGDA